MTAENNEIPAAQFVEAVAYLLRETFAGSPEGQASAYLDRGIGVFSTLNAVSASDASREFNGTTIAAQTEHAKFYLDRLCEFLNGRTDRVNWEDSWLIETVNEKEWEALCETVKATYNHTLICLAEHSAWTETEIGMAIGMVTHTAYHLGAIRQITKALQT